MTAVSGLFIIFIILIRHHRHQSHYQITITKMSLIVVSYNLFCFFCVHFQKIYVFIFKSLAVPFETPEANYLHSSWWLVAGMYSLYWISTRQTPNHTFVLMKYSVLQPVKSVVAHSGQCVCVCVSVLLLFELFFLSAW